MLASTFIPILDPPFPDARNAVPLGRPVLAMDAAWTSADSTPDFAVTIPSGALIVGDILNLHIQLTGGGWTSLVVNATHTVTAGDLADGYFGFGLSALSNADYDASVTYQHGIELSNWSAPITFTVAASGTAGQPIGLLLALTKAA